MTTTRVRLTAENSGGGRWHVWLEGVPTLAGLHGVAVVPRSIANGQFDVTGVATVDLDPTAELVPLGTVYRCDFRKVGAGVNERLYFTVPVVPVTSPVTVVDATNFISSLPSALPTPALGLETAARIAADALLIPLTQKGAANGVATLGADSKIPSAQLPEIAITNFLGAVASQAAMLALVGQRGDWCTRTDLSQSYIAKADDLTVLANWQPIATPGGVTSVDGATGAVSLSAAYVPKSGVSTERRFYVETAANGGNDTNSGLTSSKPVATLTQALVLTAAAGGGHIKMGAGVFPAPINDRTYINQSFVTIEGLPGLTILRALNLNDGGIYIGVNAFTNAGGYYEQVHLRGLIIDQTVANQTNGINANSVIFSGAKDSSISNCTVIGGDYMLTMGGAAKPALRCVAANNLFINNFTLDGYTFAPVSSKDCAFVGNKVVSTMASNVGSVDAEPNVVTDYILNLLIQGNIFEHCGGFVIQPGGATDPKRLTGVKILDNSFFNCAPLVIGCPGATISRNSFSRDKNALIYQKGVAVSLSHVNGNTVMSPDNCTIENNTFNDVGAADVVLASVITIDSSFNTVRGNKLTETREGGKRATWAVEERQLGAVLLSGGQAGTPTTLTIPIAALQLQDANAGAVRSTAAQSVTLAAASAFDRVDNISVLISTGAASVFTGASGGSSGAPAAPNTTTQYLPIAQVFVAAGATTVTVANITDRRYFRPDSNQIDQPIASRVLHRGTTKLLGQASTRVPRRRPYVTADPYQVAVLADLPVSYWPMLETAAPVFRDVTAGENDAVVDGGVLFNQAIGATGRSGAKFDGTTGYAAAEGRPDTLFRSAFTVEAQVLRTTAGSWFIAGRGVNASTFELRLQPAENLYFRVGNRAELSVGTVSTTLLTHVAAVWNGTQFIFYVNGVADAPIAVAAPVFPVGSDDWPVFLGASDNAGTGLPSSYFGGTVRHVALYSGALSAARIAAHATLM